MQRFFTGMNMQAEIKPATAAKPHEKAYLAKVGQGTIIDPKLVCLYTVHIPTWTIIGRMDFAGWQEVLDFSEQNCKGMYVDMFEVRFHPIGGRLVIPAIGKMN